MREDLIKALELLLDAKAYIYPEKSKDSKAAFLIKRIEKFIDELGDVDDPREYDPLDKIVERLVKIAGGMEDIIRCQQKEPDMNERANSIRIVIMESSTGERLYLPRRKRDVPLGGMMFDPFTGLKRSSAAVHVTLTDLEDIARVKGIIWE